jgi:hypothetical protein
MRWPGHTTYSLAMQWAQTSNPVTDTAGAIPTGYRAISIPYTNNGWSAGLQRSNVSTYSLLDGTMSPLSNWYYAVGTTYCWGDTHERLPARPGRRRAHRRAARSLTEKGWMRVWASSTPSGRNARRTHRAEG